MRILLTGGSSEIGRAAAQRAQQAGHEIVYTASSPETLERTASIYRDQRIPAEGVVLDLSRGDQEHGGPYSPELEAQLGRGFDALILNAASAVKHLRLFHETDLVEASRSLEQNVMGNLRLIQAVLPGMIERRFGRLVFVSSVTVAMGSSRYGIYSLTKGALEALFLNLAVDYGQYNILSNVVRPGTIRTERTRRFWSREKYVKRITGIIPQGEMGTPDQVAEAMAPLLSPTSYMNGSIVTVAGGLPLVRAEQI